MSTDANLRPEAASDSPYLTKTELCVRTGLSPATVHRYKRDKKIPFFQPGGAGARVLFPRDAIEIAITQRQHESALNSSVPIPINQGLAPRKRPGPQPRWRSASQ